jgi:hypothetical protein
MMIPLSNESSIFKNKFREVAMDNIIRYRAMGSLCRQHAAYNPNESWKLLAQAEHWEHLAELEASTHYEACNADNSNGQTNSRSAA